MKNYLVLIMLVSLLIGCQQNGFETKQPIGTTYEIEGKLIRKYTEPVTVQGTTIDALKIDVQEGKSINSYWIDNAKWQSLDEKVPYCRMGIIVTEYGNHLTYFECGADRIP